MRQLASVQTIREIHQIEGRDRIELAIVLGWQVIVNKADHYEPGSKCVYVEIDSVLPERPEFEFLRDKKFRIRTMKMAGTISQGICFPMSILNNPPESYEVGQDVTEELGVTKYDPEAAVESEYTQDEAKPKKKVSAFKRWMYKCRLTNGLAHKLWGNTPQRKSWPDFLQKTDETRVQSMPFILNRKDLSFECHEKVDGQSGTFFVIRNRKWFGLKTEYEFGVCSRNLRLFKPDNSSYWTVASKYSIREKLIELMEINYPNSDWIAIQGECVAPNVQGNKYHVGEADLYCFNLIAQECGKVDSLIAAPLIGRLCMKWVPLVNPCYTLPDTIQEIEAFSHGKSQLYDTLREGIVFRNYDEGISFKCVDPEFLLKWKE